MVNEPTEVENKPIQIKFKASRGKNNQAESTFVLSLAFVPYAVRRRIYIYIYNMMSCGLLVSQS